MRRSFMLLLFVAASALGTPTITGVSPTGAVGGMTITITGSGFNQPQVFVGTVRAEVLTVAELATIVAVVPPLLPGAYDVTVTQPDGSATAKGAYTVPGDAGPFEAILLSVFTAPVHGAYGSYFVTDAHAAATTEQTVNVYGAFAVCDRNGPEPQPPEPYFVTVPGGTDLPLNPSCSGGPRLLYVAASQAQNITFNERVTDVTRTASSLGTEIPVVRGSRMANRVITLLNVPIDSRYRNKLRIYALGAITVFVTTVGQEIPVTLQPGNTFVPAYAEFSDFPVPVDPGSTSKIRVTIEQKPLDTPLVPFWAFITVTNNETQQITTITPDF